MSLLNYPEESLNNSLFITLSFFKYKSIGSNYVFSNESPPIFLKSDTVKSGLLILAIIQSFYFIIYIFNMNYFCYN